MTELLPAETVQRHPPRNRHPSDDWLWDHELVKTFQSVHLLDRQDIWVNLANLSSYPLHSQPRGKAKLLMDIKNLVKTSMSLFGRVRNTMKTALCVVDELTSGAYFHWMGDVLPRLELLEEKGLTQTPILFPPMRWASALQEILAAYPFQYMVLASRERVKVQHFLHVSPLAPTGNYRPKYMQAIRKRFLRYYGLEGIQPYRKIWISRSLAPKRKITNEDDLLPLLESLGWEVWLMEKLSFERQVRLMAETRFVGGLHGAGLTNMIFMPEGGQVLEIRFKGDNQNNCYFSLASAMRHHYWYLQGNSQNRTDSHAGNLRVDLRELERVLIDMDKNGENE